MEERDRTEFFLTGYVLLPKKPKWRLVFKRLMPRDFWPQWCAANWPFLEDGIDSFDDALAEKLLKCDLNGGVDKLDHGHNDIDRWLDVPFSIKHSNLKAAASDRDYCGLVKPLVELNLPHPDKTAQVTLIETSSGCYRYLHFNMTSYDFWEDDYGYIADKYNSANLGGWMFKVGVDSTIDKKFKDIL